MNCKVCTVSFRNGGWYVAETQTTQGPYLSQGIALRIAATIALDNYRKGERMKLRIEDPAGTTAEHCLCPDRNEGAPCVRG